MKKIILITQLTKDIMDKTVKYTFCNFIINILFFHCRDI